MPIDLNADVGEGFHEADAAIVPLVTSVNIACGGHAGDEATMRRTVVLAMAHGTAIGAHPGFPDRDGFGRRRLDLPTAALVTSLEDQLRALRAITAEAGARITHVKPHGALYNEAARDRALADVVAGVVRAFDAGVRLVGLAGSALLAAGAAIGQPVAAEAFADRAYAGDGNLRPRSEPGAVLEDPRRVGMQAVAIARGRRVPIGEGRWIGVEADTICLHADTPGSIENLMAMRAALAAAGIDVARLSARG